MELDYYLFKNKIAGKEFAASIKVEPHTISRVIHRKYNPSLSTAIKIYEATNGEVSYKEMLKKEVKNEE